MALPITLMTKKFIDLFSEPFITRFPDIKSFEMLEKMNAVFIFVPKSDFCRDAAFTASGVPPYLMKMKAFSKKSSNAIDHFISKNPLISLIPEISGQSEVCRTFSYSVSNDLSYDQFVDLVEAYSVLLQKQEGIVVKRFEMSMDFETTGKMQFTALPKGHTFMDLLKSYKGDADLYDKTFNQYAWDLMGENGFLGEESNVSNDPARA